MTRVVFSDKESVRNDIEVFSGENLGGILTNSKVFPFEVSKIKGSSDRYQRQQDVENSSNSQRLLQKNSKNFIE